MIAQFFSSTAGPLVLFLLVMGAIWVWNLWDCLRHPQRPPPLRWYHFTDVPPADRWDLQTLNDEPSDTTGEREAGTRPGSCRR